MRFKKDLKSTHTMDLLDDVVYEYNKFDPREILEFEEDAVKVKRAISIVKEYTQLLYQNGVAEIY